VRQAFTDYGNWDVAALVLLRQVGRAIDRLEVLQQAPTPDTQAVYKATTLLASLLRQLSLPDLERTQKAAKTARDLAQRRRFFGSER
jgi:hypothetical protein